MPEWTEAQKEAITLDDKNSGIIVSAAAGSGKTAVLAERIARHAADGKDLSGLIAVTFTRAAASEIKSRVSDVLRKKYSETKNLIYKKSAGRVQYAKIGTIDSLFKSIVKENFATVGISPDFSYMDDTEDFAVKNENLTEILDGYYSDYRNNFEEFTELFGGEQDDETIKQLINAVYSQILSVPFWEKWFEKTLKKYDGPKFFTDAVCDVFLPYVSENISVYETAMQSGEITEKGIEIVKNEYLYLKNTERLLRERNWDGLCEALFAFGFGSALGRGAFSADSQAKKMLEKYRKDFKQRFLENEIFKIKTEEAEADLKKLKPAAKCLFEILKEYDGKNRETYEKLNRYPIAMISRYALFLAVSDYDFETRKFVPTELAKKMSEEYFEVIIDEYQDSNDLQDLFFTAISNGGKNLFVVGDVKQSIYKFRYAEPKNFLRKTEELTCLHLSQNFRSKKSILDFTNFICSGVLKESLYKNTYAEEDKLVAFREEETPGDVELYFQPVSGNGKGYNEQEAFCAEKIKEIIRSGYEIFDKK